ncbi:hypothetical protein, partial [Aphanizomenon flos-aquae]|uniref:hypothetical protein n=1 Tax=Aphanizomenon flos-aquae TaxID=1176 RepID=UPI00054E9A8A
LYDEDWFNLFFQSIIFSRFSCPGVVSFSRHLFNIAILPFSVKGVEKYFFRGWVISGTEKLETLRGEDFSLVAFVFTGSDCFFW